MIISVVFVFCKWLNYFYKNKEYLYKKVETERLRKYLEDNGFKKESFSSRQFPTYYRESTAEHKYVEEGKCVVDVPVDATHECYPFLIREAIMALSEELEVHPLSLLVELVYL